VYIEDANRQFPCGTNDVSFMQSQDQPVRVRYHINVQEMQYLIGIGLYSSGFQPPANLENNVIEIPVNVTYRGIKFSPFCMIDIEDAFEIDTATYDSVIDGKHVTGNGYVSLFATCEPDMNITPETVYGYDTTYPRYEPYKFPEKNYELSNDNPNMETQVVAEPELSEEQAAELKHIDDVNAQIQNATNEHVTKLNNVDKSNVRAFLQSVKQKAEEHESQRDDVFHDGYNAMFGNDDSSGNNQKDTGIFDKYTTLKEMSAEAIKADTDEDGEKSKDAAKKVDIALDNMALNEGITDIEGHGSAASETPAQVKEKKDAKSGKKAIEIARRNDIAADNKALNEGITDIAGQGAAHSDTRTASDLVANLFKPSAGQSGPNFL
jgi:hypothetical protein